MDKPWKPTSGACENIADGRPRNDGSVQSISLLGPQPRRTLLNKIKQCRRIATRHDKLAAGYLAFVQLASIGRGSASLRPSVGGEAHAACVCLHEGFLTSS
jgi:hypothetical protein